MNPAWQGASLRDAGSAYRLSRCVLLAHEDKAVSISIPRGGTRSPTVIADLVCAADFGRLRRRIYIFWEDAQRWEGRNWQIDIEQL
jgi:hypothetical protein